jgi:hypothetical protein
VNWSDELGHPVERAADLVGLVRPVGRENVIGLPTEEQGVDAANLLADGGDDDSHAPILEQGLIAVHSQRP